ncbi:MAG: thermopsin family protease [Thermoplasmata archaeon]
MSAHGSRARSLGVIAVVVAIGALMVLPGGTVLASVSPSVGPTGATPTATPPVGTGPLPSVGASRPAAPSLTVDLASSPDLMGASRISGSWVQGLLGTAGSKSARPLVSYPNLGLLEHPETGVSTTVVPGYVSQPAPFGIADYGLGVTPYAYSTPHFLGSATFSAPPNVTDPGASEVIDPGASHLGDVGSVYEFGIQLNTVLTNVSIPGNDAGVFWTQNVVNVNDTGIHFVDDIFNFSANSDAYISPAAPATIRSGCGLASVSTILTVYGGVYQCVGETIPISAAAYPLTISLYNNATTSAGNDTVLTFGYDIAGALGSWNGTSDTVTFNDPTAALGPPEQPAGFTVSGTTPAPIGLLEDSELDIVGSIGGANAVFRSINGSVDLEYSNASAGGWQSVPSAYNFGSDTGETSTGIAGVWSGTTESIDQGPSFLYGLWNAVPYASVASGSIHVSGTIAPSYGFAFLSNVAPDPNATNFTWVPTNAAGDFDTYLPPSVPPATQYYLQAWAPGAEEVNRSGFSGSTLFSISLPASSPGAPIEAPLYLSGNAQLAALALAISGSAGAPYNFSDLVVAMNLTFNHLNDFGFPTFVIFQAEGVSAALVVNNLSQGNDSPSGNFYYSDLAPSPGPVGLLDPGATRLPDSHENYSAQVQVMSSSALTVTNETLEGSSDLGSDQGGVVFLWGDVTPVVRAVKVGAGPYGFSYGGVFVGDSSGATVQNVSVSGGSNGVDDVGSVGTFVENVTASGTGTFGVYALSTTLTAYWYVNATDNATGVYAGGYAGPDPYYATPGTYDAGIEYVRAVGNVSSSSATVGVTLYWSNRTTVEYVAANGSAIGVAAYFSTTTTVEYQEVNVAGGFTGTDLEIDRDLRVLYTSVSGVGPGNYLSGDGAVNVSFATSPSGATTAEVFQCAGVEIWSAVDTFVEGASQLLPASAAVTLGEVQRSEVVGANATDDGVAVYLEDGSDQNVIEYANATNHSYAVGAGLFSPPSADDTISDVSAENQSVGVYDIDSPSFTISGVRATDLSGAVGLQDANNTTVTGVSVTDLSVGVLDEESHGNTITDVRASNATLESPWDPPAISILNAPVAAVVTQDVDASTISGVSATDYPVAVYDGFYCGAGPTCAGASAELTVQDVNASGGEYAILANYTQSSRFFGIDAFQDDIGLAAFDDANNTITGGRFVDDTSYGISLSEANPSHDTIWLNDFLGNNGATSSYRAAHIQAYDAERDNDWYACSSISGVSVCRGNYWSDWHLYSSPGVLAPYFIPTDNYDYYPLSTPAGESTVVFSEVGLPGGSAWSLTFDGSTETTTASSVSFAVLPGTHPFSVGAVAGYTVVPRSGSVTTAVGEAPTTISLAYTAVYAVTVRESGLASGTSWTAIVGGISNTSTTSAIGFTLPAGTYQFQIVGPSGASASPYSGTLSVTDVAYTLWVTFALPAPPSTVVVMAAGLPTGTGWSAIVGGSLASTVGGSSLNFSFAAGTYAYQILPVPGYTVSPSGGTITLGASGYALVVTFVPVTYAVTLSEVGLSVGTSWSASVNGVSQSTVGTTLTWYLANGTYTYLVSIPSGYTVSAASGVVLVSGNPAGASLAYHSTASPPLVSVETLTLLIAILALIVALVAVAVRGRKSEPPAPPPVAEWTPIVVAPAAAEPTPATEGEPAPEAEFGAPGESPTGSGDSTSPSGGA